jgi:hypothetical protein
MVPLCAPTKPVRDQTHLKFEGKAIASHGGQTVSIVMRDFIAVGGDV